MTQKIIFAALACATITGPAFSETLDSRIKLCLEGEPTEEQSNALIADLTALTRAFSS